MYGASNGHTKQQELRPPPPQAAAPDNRSERKGNQATPKLKSTAQSPILSSTALAQEACAPNDLKTSKVSWYFGMSNKHTCIDSCVMEAAKPRPTITCHGPLPGTSLKSSSLSSACLTSFAMSFCILFFFIASTTTSW